MCCLNDLELQKIKNNVESFDELKKYISQDLKEPSSKQEEKNNEEN